MELDREMEYLVEPGRGRGERNYRSRVETAVATEPQRHRDQLVSVPFFELSHLSPGAAFVKEHKDDRAKYRVSLVNVQSFGT